MTDKETTRAERQLTPYHKDRHVTANGTDGPTKDESDKRTEETTGWGRGGKRNRQKRTHKNRQRQS